MIFEFTNKYFKRTLTTAVLIFSMTTITSYADDSYISTSAIGKIESDTDKDGKVDVLYDSEDVKELTDAENDLYNIVVQLEKNYEIVLSGSESDRNSLITALNKLGLCTISSGASWGDIGNAIASLGNNPGNIATADEIASLKAGVAGTNGWITGTGANVSEQYEKGKADGSKTVTNVTDAAYNITYTHHVHSFSQTNKTEVNKSVAQSSVTSMPEYSTTQGGCYTTPKYFYHTHSTSSSSETTSNQTAINTSTTSTTGGGCFTVPIYHMHSTSSSNAESYTANAGSTSRQSSGGGCFNTPVYHSHSSSCYKNVSCGATGANNVKDFEVEEYKTRYDGDIGYVKVLVTCAKCGGETEMEVGMADCSKYGSNATGTDTWKSKFVCGCKVKTIKCGKTTSTVVGYNLSCSQSQSVPIKYGLSCGHNAGDIINTWYLPSCNHTNGEVLGFNIIFDE